MAAPAALQSVAVEAQVPLEPAVPVRARLVLVRPPVLTDLLRLAALVPARLPVRAQRPFPAALLLEARPLLAHWVSAVQVVRLLSRRSF